MKIRFVTLALPIVLLAGCGGGADEITTTNSGNVILNDAQANYSFENDEPVNTVADDMNAMMEGNVVETDGSYGGMTNAADNAM